MTALGGLLIVIDGIDGAGKSTLAAALAGRLSAAGATVVSGKEPTCGPWGMQLRVSACAGRLAPEEERRLLLLDRRQHVDEVIRPALNRGEIVILDRYYPSMVAYQGAAGIPVAQLMDDNRFAPRPDVLLLLDLTPAEGLARIAARGDQPNAFETMDNLQAVRRIFLSMDDAHLRVINASRPAHTVMAEAWLQVQLALTAKFQKIHGTTPEAVEAIGPYLRGAL